MSSTFLASNPNEVTPENFSEAMQQAIEIEIATIPIYLSTYYSINRTPDQGAITASIKQLLMAGKNRSKVPYTAQDAEQLATQLSAKIMVFANKAGATILSVVIEEMLHMSLSSNVMQALVGNPKLVNKSPVSWPAYLAGHDPRFPINRAKLSFDQLYTFMQIESPYKLLGTAKKATAIHYTTIGEFYGMIKQCIKDNFEGSYCYNVSRPQLVPKMGYYAQNDIDTMYYDKQHKPKFENAGDSGDLIHVVDQVSALKAIDEIVEQGEGYHGRGFDHDGGVICGPFHWRSYDNKARSELAHFDKFNQLWCEMQHLDQEFEKYFGDICDSNDSQSVDPKSFFIHHFELNPNTADYPEIIQKVSHLTNAVASYLYVMTEACYCAEKNTQYEIFMFGIHKSMMWILGSLCSELPNMKYIGKDGMQYQAAPTFENYFFSAVSSPKQQIIDLFNDAEAAYPTISYMKERIYDLPNVPLESYLTTPEKAILA